MNGWEVYGESVTRTTRHAAKSDIFMFASLRRCVSLARLGDQRRFYNEQELKTLVGRHLLVDTLSLVSSVLRVTGSVAITRASNESLALLSCR